MRDDLDHKPTRQTTPWDGFWEVWHAWYTGLSTSATRVTAAKPQTMHNPDARDRIVFGEKKL